MWLRSGGDRFGPTAQRWYLCECGQYNVVLNRIGTAVSEKSVSFAGVCNKASFKLFIFIQESYLLHGSYPQTGCITYGDWHKAPQFLDSLIPDMKNW